MKNFFKLAFTFLCLTSLCACSPKKEEEQIKPPQDDKPSFEYDEKSSIDITLDKYIDFNELYFKKKISQKENGLITTFINITDEEWYEVSEDKLSFNTLAYRYDGTSVLYETTVDVSQIKDDLNKVLVIKGLDRLETGTKRQKSQKEITDSLKVVDVNGVEKSVNLDVKESNLNPNSKGLYKLVYRVTNDLKDDFLKEVVVNVRQEFSVLYCDENGAKLQEDILFYGERSFYKGQAPDKDSDGSKDYDFIGWTKDNKTVYETKSIKEDVVLYPYFVENGIKLNISFVYKNGAIKEKMMLAGDSLNLDDIPSINGYKNVGLYLDEDYTKEVDLSQKIYEDKTFHVKVEVIKKTLTVKSVLYNKQEILLKEIEYDVESPYDIENILIEKPEYRGQFYTYYNIKNDELKIYYDAIKFNIEININKTLYDFKAVQTKTKELFKFEFTMFDNKERADKLESDLNEIIKTKLNYSGSAYFVYDLNEIVEYLNGENFAYKKTFDVNYENRTTEAFLKNGNNVVNKISYGLGNYTFEELLKENNISKTEEVKYEFDLSHYEVVHNNKKFYIYCFENSEGTKNFLKLLKEGKMWEDWVSSPDYHAYARDVVIRNKIIEPSIKRDIESGSFETFIDYLNTQGYLYQSVLGSTNWLKLKNHSFVEEKLTFTIEREKSFFLEKYVDLIDERNDKIKKGSNKIKLEEELFSTSEIYFKGGLLGPMPGDKSPIFGYRINSLEFLSSANINTTLGVFGVHYTMFDANGESPFYLNLFDNNYSYSAWDNFSNSPTMVDKALTYSISPEFLKIFERFNQGDNGLSGKEFEKVIANDYLCSNKIVNEEYPDEVLFAFGGKSVDSQYPRFKDPKKTFVISIYKNSLYNLTKFTH